MITNIYSYIDPKSRGQSFVWVELTSELIQNFSFFSVESRYAAGMLFPQNSSVQQNEGELNFKENTFVLYFISKDG